MIDLLLFAAHLDGGETRLRDGTVIQLSAPHGVCVTLPSAAVEARYRKVWDDHFAQADRRWRIALAMAVKTAEPKRSISSIATALNLSPGVVSRWVAKARAA